MAPSPAALAVVGGAALAVSLLVPAPARLHRGGIRSHGRTVRLLAVAVLVAGLLLVARAAELLLLGVVVTGALAAVGLVWRRVRARGVRLRRRDRVGDLCELLAAELRSGQPPIAALDRAATDWPELQPVHRAALMGVDVPGALRALSTEPGAEDLREVAAAWQVARASGGGLADAVGRMADRVRADRATRRVVAAELASARATARMMALLPALALLMGSGIGGDPWRFLFGTTIGVLCLGAGLACAALGLWWIEAIAESVERAGE